jgi:ankyrin repeat protein
MRENAYQVNYQSYDSGLSVLHIAVKCKRIGVVEYLLGTKDIDLNLQDKNGNTPLHVALIVPGNFQIAKALIEYTSYFY